MEQNNLLIIGLVIGVVIMIAAAVMLMGGAPPAQPPAGGGDQPPGGEAPPAGGETPPATPESPPTGGMDLSDTAALWMSGTPVKCTGTPGGVQTTMYTKNKKMRAERDSGQGTEIALVDMQNEKLIVMHMYDPMSDMWIKMEIDVEEWEQYAEDNPDASMNVDFSENPLEQMSCTLQDIDDSMFEVPPGAEVMDMTQFLQAMAGMEGLEGLEGFEGM